MQYKLKITLQAPLMVGGKKLNEYYRKSLDYISGGVLRAAFAKSVIEGCNISNPTSGSKRFWVSYKALPECEDCKANKICQNFEALSFGNGYLHGAKVYPITARKCKYESSHDAFDTLIDRFKVDEQGEFLSSKCRTPGCEERSENHGGYYIVNGNKVSDVTVKTKVITRLGMDRYRKVSAEGQLFSLVPIAEKVKGESVIFEALLKSPVPLEANDIPEFLRLGGYRSSGLGLIKLNIEPAEIETSEKLRSRVDKFNSKLESFEDQRYFSITLQADLIVSLEEVLRGLNSMPSAINTERYYEIIETRFAEALDLVGIIKAEEIMLSSEFRQGFDTSTENGSLKKPKLLINKGSVLVFSFPRPESEKVFAELLRVSNEGLGEETQDGFGNIRICDEFHLG